MEIVKSEVITVASCSVQNKTLGLGGRNTKARKGVRFHGHEKWTPVHEAGGTTARFHGGNKIWRFKNISFPWLPRPSKKAAYEDGRGNKKGKIAKTRGQGRVLRTNSAPKTLGLEFRERQIDRNVLDLSDVEERDGTTTSEQVNGEKIEQATLRPPPAMSPWKRRRVSLPDFGADARRLRESGAIGMSLREQCCLTPNSNRKKFLPVEPNTTEENKHNILSVEENNCNGHKQKRSSLEQVIDIRKLSDPIRKIFKSAEEKPRSNSLEIPDVRVLSLDENSNKYLPPTKVLSQNVVEDIEQPSNAHKPSRRCVQVKKVTNPDVFFVPIPDENVDSYNDDDEEDDEEARLSSSEPTLGYLSHPEIRHLADLMPLNITIQEIMRAELQAQLEMREFSVDLCQEWCKEICQGVKRQVQELRSDLYKVVCVVYIGALRGHGVHASVQCLWSPQDDNFTTVSYKNHSLFAIASVLAMKYE